MTALTPILIALAIQLAPVAGGVLADLFELLCRLIPQVDRDFVAACLRITKGIRDAHPDWPESQIRRYAADAVIQMAADQGYVLPPTLLSTLGLAGAATPTGGE